MKMGILLTFVGYMETSNTSKFFLRLESSMENCHLPIDDEIMIKIFH